ncbi:MAG: hypothetical protein ACXQS2_05605 [Methermicoccaceae archaeon]
MVEAFCLRCGKVVEPVDGSLFKAAQQHKCDEKDVKRMDELIDKYNLVFSAIPKVCNDGKLLSFLLGELHEKLRQYFPDAESFVLSYSAEHECVMLYVVLDKEPEEARRQLQKFDEEWWLDMVPKYKNLSIHLRLVGE